MPGDVTVAHNTVIGSVIRAIQDSCFHAEGRYWVFYVDDLSDYYRSSTDGIAWSDATQVGNSQRGYDMSVWYDGQYVHYVRSLYVDAGELYYRRGLPQGNGNITWSAEQLVYDATTHMFAGAPTVATDSDGYPYIAFILVDKTAYPQERTSVVYMKSSTNNGTWTTEWEEELAAHADGNELFPDIIPLNSGEMYAVYCRHEGGNPWSSGPCNQIKGRLWNGSAWGDEEICTSSNVENDQFTEWEAVAVGNDVHLVFLQESTYNITYVKRTYGSGWSTEETLQPATARNVIPAIARDGADLYCFWLGPDDYVYYKQCHNGSWDSSPTQCFDETARGFCPWPETNIQAAYESQSGEIGVLWEADTGNTSAVFIHLGIFSVESSPTPSPSPTVSPTPTATSTPDGQGFTVTDTSSYRSVRTPAQRSNFYASGRHWVFYETDDDIYYRSSTTGQNWSSAVLVEVEECPFKYGAMFDVWQDSGYAHFVFAPLKGGTPAGNISYKRGELNASGNISWDPVQIVYSCPSEYRIGDPVITVSEDGYPYIAAGIYYHDGTTSNVTVFRSSVSNGTWVQEWAANISGSEGILLSSLTPLEDDEMLCTYYSATVEGDNIKARLWNGSDWEDEEVCTDEGIPQYSFSSYSVVATNSTVHLVYLGNLSYNLSYVCRDAVSGWGSEEVIYANSASWQTAPALSRYGEDVYCFWLDDSGGGWVLYRVLSNGSWGETVGWIQETLPFTLNYTIQSSYDLTGDLGGVLYQVNTSSPYQIRFGRDAF